MLRMGTSGVGKPVDLVKFCEETLGAGVPAVDRTEVTAGTGFAVADTAEAKEALR
jgi:hypothetical protein